MNQSRSVHRFSVFLDFSKEYTPKPLLLTLARAVLAIVFFAMRKQARTSSLLHGGRRVPDLFPRTRENINIPSVDGDRCSFGSTKPMVDGYIYHAATYDVLGSAFTQCVYKGHGGWRFSRSAVVAPVREAFRLSLARCWLTHSCVSLVLMLLPGGGRLLLLPVVVLLLLVHCGFCCWCRCRCCY